MASRQGHRPLRILITNNTLDRRAGSELVVRDLALELVRRGHLPVAYSTVLGEVAEELGRATVPVIDDLGKLNEPPDVIHGHHHLETMTAALSFPTSPVIYVCHGWLPWEEAPPAFDTICRYVAVDDLCRERLLTSEGVRPDRISTIYNFVDLERFVSRGALPPAPKSALVFSNYTAGVPEEIRAACTAAGFERIEALGVGAGNSSATPESILPQFDLVFAKGRAALEALACGCSVIVCDYSRIGSLVTTSNLSHFRRLNFGVRSLQRPLSRESILGELGSYDAGDAKHVSDWVRADASLPVAVDQYMLLYERAMQEHERDAPSIERLKLAGRYLRWLSPTMKATTSLHSDLARLQADLAELSGVGAKLSASEATLASARAKLAELSEVSAKLSVSEATLASTQAKLAELSDRTLQKENELLQIKSSRAWRAIQAYGRLKGRIWKR